MWKLCLASALGLWCLVCTFIVVNIALGWTSLLFLTAFAISFYRLLELVSREKL